MDFLSPKWEQETPGVAERTTSLSALTLAPANFASPRLDELLLAIRSTHQNGGAYFGRWRLPEDPILHWYASRNRLDEMGFSPVFLTASLVRATLPDLSIPPVLNEPPQFASSNSFLLDGDL